MSDRPARLCLADGTTFEGTTFGAPLDRVFTGEVVFTTGMTGYQEVLTDPSFTGQIVAMTAPQIGNTGVNWSDPEAVAGTRPHVAGFVVREAASDPSSWRAQSSLAEHLERTGVAALSGIDTRRLTRHLRTVGAQNGAIGTLDAATLVDHARAARSMEGADLVGEVTCAETFTFDEATPAEFRTLQRGSRGAPRVVALDLGIKKNILRSLVDVGCAVTVVPARTSAEEILSLGPDGVFVSNGPGDPAAVTYAIRTIEALLGKKPLFGICLGHQLLALALGAKTYKLHFGHRGLNQPVQNLTTKRVEITSQNHGFAVDLESLPRGVSSSYVHLNDGTSEGLEVPAANAFSVQFHPEAAAGPHDTLHLFRRFYDAMTA